MLAIRSNAGAGYRTPANLKRQSYARFQLTHLLEKRVICRRREHGEPHVQPLRFGRHQEAGKNGAGAPDAWKAFLAFDRAALADGAIPKKYKELMALAVALTTQCPYCLAIHKEAAIKAGVTPEELSETVFISAALRAGASVTHGTHLVE